MPKKNHLNFRCWGCRTFSYGFICFRFLAVLPSFTTLVQPSGFISQAHPTCMIHFCIGFHVRSLLGPLEPSCPFAATSRHRTHPPHKPDPELARPPGPPGSNETWRSYVRKTMEHVGFAKRLQGCFQHSKCQTWIIRSRCGKEKYTIW